MSDFSTSGIRPIYPVTLDEPDGVMTMTTTSASAPATSSGGKMEWLTAVGALANPIASIVDGVTGTGKAKAEAAEAAANAQTAQYQAQVQAAQVQAETTRQTMMYALLSVGVLVVGIIGYKAFS